MRKFLILVLILSIYTTCYGEESSYRDEKSTAEEINLDVNIPSKGYNLSKPKTETENKVKYYDDSLDVPIDFMPAPMQLLKQYRDGNI